MVWKVWDLANGITGFAALQGIAFVFAFRDTTFREIIPKVCIPVYVTITAIHLLFIGGVISCNRIALRILETDKTLSEEKDDKRLLSYAWKWITVGRIITIVLFFLVSVSMIAVVLLKARG